MASAESSVWLGFIEGLPVVGSVKEAVEWVLAVAADDLALASEKLQVIHERFGEGEKLTTSQLFRTSSGYSTQSTMECSSQSSSGYSSQSSLGYSPQSSLGYSPQTVGKESACLAAMDVECIPEMKLLARITEVMGKHDKKKGKQPVQPKTAQTVKGVQDETLRKIHLINQNFHFKSPLVDDGKRSRRGEHVINNDVITFYYKVVDDFMKTTFYQPNTLGIDDPLSENTAVAIMNELVVNFDEDELYINANALIYGEYSLALRNALNRFLRLHRQGGLNQEEATDTQNHVSNIVVHMNREEAYVDPFAKVKWIRNLTDRQQRFTEIKDEVAHMFTTWPEYFGVVLDKLP